MKKLCFALLFVTASLAKAQDKPKLVVGIVVDQMRMEYLYRFESKLGTGGFKRLMGDGFLLKNAHYNYIPTLTGPGHASIYTGSTPAIHGIIANDWYDPNSKTMVNCVDDDRQKMVGVENGKRAASPWKLLTSTISDELKLATQKHAKVIGISLKDRSAVLPVGHMADAAYWLDSPTGNFVSSSFYKPGLPQWLDKFNALKLTDQYLNREWNTVLPIEKYVESGPDDSKYETKLKGKDSRPTFPYNLKEVRKNFPGFDLIVTVPFGNDLIADLAKATLEGEELGKDDVTDFLAISFSSTDYLGHAMGPNSVEVEDAYIRLDKNIEDLLNELDKKVGVGQYTLFLTADHAVADNPIFMVENKFSGGGFNQANVQAGLNDLLKKYFHDSTIVERIYNEQVFLKRDAFAGDLKSSGVDLLVATELISQYLMKVPGVADVYSATLIHASDYGEKGLKGSLVRGYNRRRSGDILFVLEPNWLTWGQAVGTTHGSGYAYDTHVPVLFYGWGIKKGSTSNPHTITDIAPTISTLLKTKFPSGCTGQPVTEAMKE